MALKKKASNDGDIDFTILIPLAPAQQFDFTGLDCVYQFCNETSAQLFQDFCIQNAHQAEVIGCYVKTDYNPREVAQLWRDVQIKEPELSSFKVRTVRVAPPFGEEWPIEWGRPITYSERLRLEQKANKLKEGSNE